MAYPSNSWAALADPTRRTIFERLIEHPSAVGELARELPVSRPAVSQHLRVLKDAGLVVDKRAGKQRIYQVDPDGLAALRAELDRFWTKTLDRHDEGWQGVREGVAGDGGWPLYLQRYADRMAEER